MQIRHLKTIIAPSDTLNRINAISWSVNNQKLAIASADRVIQLFDETGERKDRFATKPADPKTGTNYNIVALSFSPDCTKLAVAQSDCVVFVYKLGAEWGEKKSICNKFLQNCEITCMTWPLEQHNTIVFGMFDGKVRVGHLKTNKAATLFQTESCVISCASSPDGNAVITGHLDGSINRFFFDDGVSGASQGKFTVHSCPPYALAWGENVVAAGNDRIVRFYDSQGQTNQEFDYSKDNEEQEFTCAEASPSGQSVVLGSFNRLRIFNFLNKMWEEAPVKIVENFYTVVAVGWKPDGSRLIAANMCGTVELWDCCLRRTRYKGKFEFTYVSPSQVIVKRLSTGSRIILKSHYNYEILKVNIFQDQFLVANTPMTLLLGDLASCKLSEIPWTGGGGMEKFYFENMHVCMVFNAGEMTLVEYGVNEVLGSVRTEHTNPHLISVRINERKSEEDVKKIAYLIDLQTIYIMDLISGLNVASINHDVRIDWLELSGKANKLLFRDKKHQLHLYDVASQTRKTLLNYCSYVQWVPHSDVVVAQSRGNLCIWYAIESPERVTMLAIKGDVENIERANRKTEVIVDEGVNTVSYTLDEGLIEFGTALDDKDFDRAIDLLETLELTLETEAMWKTLSQIALDNRKLAIAERCYAALGDVARAKYLNNLNSLLENSADPGIDSVVRAKIAVLDKQFKLAESIYLEQGKIEEAMSIYQEIHKWDLSIKVAESRNHPELANLKHNYMQWLMESGQEDKAGEVKEEEGDYMSAINLYLRGGMPSRAVTVLQKQPSLNSNMEIIERVAAALFKSGLFEKAGELFEKMGSNERALDAYRRGKAFRAAVELARIVFPQEVVDLEEQWGDQLVSQKQMDAAINHYIEAGKSIKAVESAIAAKQWKKAVGIVDALQPPELGKPYFLKLAKHFEEVNEFAAAEKYFVAAGTPQEAVNMYTKANKWEKAHSLASSFMTQEQVAFLYVSQAREMEIAGKLKEAERLYLTVGEPDLAINMYRNHKHYDHMIRLVTSYHKDLLGETHLYLAKSLETEGNLKLAEHHYIEGKDWKSAVNMYCANNNFEEGYRVAKSFGGPNSAKQVAYLWARSLGGESAAKLLTKFGLLDSAIDFACENGAFEFAFELGRFTDKSKLLDIHSKHAMHLEDEGNFKEAENAFILGGKPKEAILMYIHNEDWEAALKVAETYDPTSVPDVLISEAKSAFNKKDFSKAEALLLRAQRPEIAIRFYKEAGMWKDVLRFTKEYLPSKMSEVHEEYEHFLAGRASGGSGKDELLATAKMLEQQKEYAKAVDMYLKISSDSVSDSKILEEAWEHAVELAIKFLPDRTQDVVIQVCSRYQKIGKLAEAAELYTEIEMYKEAIDAFIQANLWEKAKEIVALVPKYAEYVENAHIKHLKNTGMVEDLITVDVAAGLDLLAQRGEWEKCLQTASQQGGEVLNKYLLGFCASLMKENKYEQAVKEIIRYGVPSGTSNFDLYTRLSRELFYSGPPESIKSLREMLFKLVHGATFVPQSNIPPQFLRYLTISHLLNFKNHCLKKKDLHYFAAKQAISLLRYTQDIPADKTFYDAGQAAKMAGFNNMAFVCFNRFLDISEAIEEGDASILENSDFVNTDVPYDIQLPSENIPNINREEIRDWVLQVSLDRKVNQEVDKRNCEECNTSIYDASLNCYNCKSVSEACIVSGML
ncbi:hypothetical protein HK098_008226 [Nowakowskiella sp. JEL0407]|nr:hypothetical protein HK098_008226 [Nowakowskiella sp. JEL0407]